MRRLAAVALLALAAGCSRREQLNYKHCLKLRVGMTKSDMVKIMGRPERTIPYVEGKSLAYLKGRTAYEWSNPAEMPAGDHVSLDDASGTIESIRCSEDDIQASVFVEPPAPSTAAAVSRSTAPALPAPAAVAVSSVPAPTLDDAVAAFRKKDFVTAMRIAGPLAQSGDANAQMLAGMIFLDGAAKGREKEGRGVALMWLYKSSRQQNAEAQAVYASQLQTNGTPDVTVAAEIKTASDLKSPAGEYLLAEVLLKNLYPDQIAQDPDMGESLLLESAQGGDPTAQLELARRQQTAHKDLVEAYRWALTASRHPLVDKLADPLHSLSTSWTPEQRADAQKLLRELKALMKPAQLKDAESRAAQSR